MTVGTPEAPKAPRTVREEFDRILTTLRQALAFWKRSLAVFLVVVAATVAFVLVSPRSYTSETVISYQEGMRAGDLVGEGGAENARRAGARLREVLLSRAVLEPLITELQLYPKIIARRGLVDAVDEMRKHVRFRAREGDTFEIAFESDTARGAQEVAKRLADRIVQEASSRRAEQAKTLKEFLDAESDRNKVGLREKEGQLAKFLAIHPEFAGPTTPDGRPTALPATAPNTLPKATDPISALEWKASQIERQLKASPGSVEPPKPRKKEVPRLPDSPELVAARRDLDDKVGRFTEKHPDVIAARARLRSAEAAQAAAQAAADQAAQDKEEPPVVPATDENREALTKRLAELKAIIAARRANPGGASPSPATSASPAGSENPEAVSLEVEFRRLQREATDARERQRQLDDSSFKASLAANSVMNDRNIQVSVLDPAYLPTHPSSRPRSVMAGIGLAIALALAIATALISLRLDDRIHDRVDLETLGILPIVAVIPAPKVLPRKSG